ncbi:ATP-binding cassette domain-containing protein [Vibrio sinensis]|uniref:Vitamin B12 import ATP-binding protein BtuD n=1 Tax=Vibrio sinensis TaxID=2302434 RepID=A0A3A6QJZ6_9VIBR|nr:ATP-binding cassette domain-containing protein [Vibrio sinensis]RJX72915.1 ATP-binding cassette domain-containing protein [Vibrio sinensis]
MIHVNGVSVSSRLLPLSFQCKAGEIIHVIGPNGSGKSTLLSAIAGLLPYKGQVEIFDLNVASASLETLASYRAMLSQSDRPAFNLDVAQYLSLSIPNQTKGNASKINSLDAKTSEINASKINASEINRVVNELTGLLRLEDKLHRSIHHLSGGEWQRVRLCAICLQVWPSLNPFAKLLILDEPAAPLDIGQEGLLYQLIQHVSSLGIAVIMSNHDLNRTAKYADKAVLLDKGVMQAEGPVQSVLDPELLSRVYHTQVERVMVKGQSILLFD